MKQVGINFNDWISVLERPIPNDNTPIYKVICDRDGDLVPYVYETTGKKALNPAYKKAVFWMFAPTRPSLPKGTYIKKDKENHFRKIGTVEL